MMNLQFVGNAVATGTILKATLFLSLFSLSIFKGSGGCELTTFDNVRCVHY